jgi:D-hydroxyproline dehydrogenase subunit gamma
MPETVTLLINGEPCRVAAGSTVAAAILRSGRTAFRTSVTGEPRAALCGMGICFECRVTVNDLLHGRSCQIVAEQGMVVVTE